jgi:hypothetical protein
MSEPGHVGEPGGLVVQTEGGDPEPGVMRRGRDVVLGESISAEPGVNQRPASRSLLAATLATGTIRSAPTKSGCKHLSSTKSIAPIQLHLLAGLSFRQ